VVKLFSGRLRVILLSPLTANDGDDGDRGGLIPVIAVFHGDGDDLGSGGHHFGQIP